MSRLYGNSNGLVAIVECRFAHRWRIGFAQARQDSPAMQLQYAATHQRVSGDGVRTIATMIDGQNTHSFPRHQHRGRSAGAARSDDERVIGFVSEHCSIS
jgi:hypothetical protein